MQAWRIASIAAGLAVALGAGLAAAQRPAPAAPAFAAPDLTPAGVKAMAANCAGCHGTDGHAVAGSDALGLAGLPRQRFVSRMTSFRDGPPRTTIMHQLAKGFSDAEIAALAEHFASIPRAGGRP